MKKITILFFTLCVSLNLVAQETIQKAQQKASEAMQQYYAKDFKASLQSFEEALKVKELQHDGNLYNAACSAALCGEKNKAWKYLDMAIAAGYDNYPHLFKDADLETLHSDAKWKKLQSEKGLDVEKIKKAFANLKTEAQLMQLIPFNKNGLYGYMQYGTKKVMVEPMFNRANLFYVGWNGENKRMELERNGYKVWIKANGEVFTDFPDSDFSPPMMEAMPMGGGDEPFRPKADKEGLGFSSQLGTIVSYSKDYTTFSEFTMNEKTCAIVTFQGKKGIVDEDGKAVHENFDTKYKEINYAVLSHQSNNPIVIYTQTTDDKWNIYSSGGTLIYEKLDQNPNYQAQYFLIKKDGKHGVISTEGKEIIKTKYKESYYYIQKHLTAKNEPHHLFQFKLEGDKDFFYVDENGVEYR